MRGPQTISGRRRDDVALGAPIEELSEIDESPLRGARRAAAVYPFDDVEDIPLANLGNWPAVPIPRVITFQDAPIFAMGGCT